MAKSKESDAVEAVPVDAPAPPAKVQQKPVQIRHHVRTVDPQALISQAVEAGASVETLERLMALAKDVRAEQAREAWYDAMAAFQQTCPPVMKTETADTGRFTYRYAPLDEIMRVVSPVLGGLGLSVSWQQTHEQGRVVASCRVSHVLGHSESSGPVAVPVDSDSRMGASAAQRVGIAMTYARRYSLLAVLGIAPEDDPDARGTGQRQVAMPKAKQSQTSEPVTVKKIVPKSGKRKDGSTWEAAVIHFSDDVEAWTFDARLIEYAGEMLEQDLALVRTTHEAKTATGTIVKVDTLEEA